MKSCFNTNLMRCLWLLMAVSMQAHAQTASYQAYSPATYSWIDISATGTTVSLSDDSVSGLINIGFTFNFGGTNYTQLRIGSNGWIFFGATSTVYNNTSVATAPLANVMMPYWTDLDPASVATRVRYRSQGSAPNRQFIVSYLAVPTYSVGGANTLQLVLNEDGSFVYAYQSTNTQGGGTNPEGATIGYRFSATDLVQFSLNTASAPNASAIYWSRPPVISSTKTSAVLSDPINNTTNPKRIPGAVVQYTVRVSNAGGGKADSTVVSDGIPPNTTLFTGNVSGGAPYVFADGTPTSALACAFSALGNLSDCVDFSNDGGSSWTYVPNGAYDPAVTHLRFRLTGRMAAAVSGNPSFELRFNVRVN